MTTHSESYQTILEQDCSETIGLAAPEVDARASFRARAAGVMAPTTDVLYDFIGKAACGMNLF